MAASFRSEDRCNPITNHFGYGTCWNDGVTTCIVPSKHESDIWQNIWIIVDFFWNCQQNKIIRKANNVDANALLDVLPKAIVIAPDMARPWRSLRSPLIAVRYPTLSSVFLWLPSTDAGELMKRMNATRTRDKACSVDMAPELFYGADHDRAAKMCQKTAAKKREKEKRLISRHVKLQTYLYLVRWHHQFPDFEHASLYSTSTWLPF